MSEADALKDWNDKGDGCHCGKDGHALNSVNCPVHGDIRANNLSKLNHARAKIIERQRAALESIAGWRNVNISGEYEHGLRDIIRSITDCAVAGLEASGPPNDGLIENEDLLEYVRSSASAGCATAANLLERHGLSLTQATDAGKVQVP